MNTSNFSRRDFLTRAAIASSPLFAHRSLAADAPKVPTVLDALSREVADASLSMKFPGGTAEQCQAWQAAFAKKLRELLGPFDPPKTWKTTIRATTEFPDHIRQDLVLEADGHPLLPVYLLLPRPKAAKRVPGIVALHGHGMYGHHAVAGRDDLPGVAKSIAGSNYDYGRQLARRGYAVACPCFTPFGERLHRGMPNEKQDLCGDTFMRMLMLGKVLLAENLRDARWAFELLAQHKDVDADRIGCVGLSLGGRMTTFTAALEPRVKVAVIAGALNVMQERASKVYGCGSQIVPGLLKYGDIPEVASLIAPRPCLWTVGSQDKLLPEKWAEEALARQGKAYDAYGAKDKLQVHRFDGGHRWEGEKAFPLLEGVLKG